MTGTLEENKTEKPDRTRLTHKQATNRLKEIGRAHV